MKFGLLPNLRVTRVTDEMARICISSRKAAKTTARFTPSSTAPAMGKEHSISIEYAGDKVLVNAGNGGSFYVAARESWYPNLNGFGEKPFTISPLKFRHKYVISVGKLEARALKPDLPSRTGSRRCRSPSPDSIMANIKRSASKTPSTATRSPATILEDLPDSLSRNQRVSGLCRQAA